MVFPSASLLLHFVLFAFVHATSINDWRSRSIYQIITDRFARTDGSVTHPCNPKDKKYCGGTWQGIINQLDYIQGMGFTAIWISPIVKNIEGSKEAGEPYHGFWSQDITKVNAHFGTKDDLKALSKALHDRDMLLMIDVVANNFAFAGPGAQTNYSSFVPFNSKEYFHPFCYIQDYTDDNNSQQCWLGNDVLSLPDVNTELESVRSIWDQWAKDVVANYSIDGMRVDAAKHVSKPFWTQFQPSADIYTMGEVLSDKADYTCDYMSNALSGVLNYPMWFALNNTFLSNPPLDMAILEHQYRDMIASCQDTTLLGTFTENQDQPRLAHYTSSITLLKSALAFAFLTDGIPTIYYGSEQALNGLTDPDNREALWLTGYNTSSPLYLAITAMNTARNAVARASTYTYWSGYWTWKSKIVMVGEQGEMMVVRKGYDRSIVTVLTNRGEGSGTMGPYQVGDTNFGEGRTVLDVLGCQTQVVGKYGVIEVTIKNGEPQAWIETDLMANSTICPNVDKTAQPLKKNLAISLLPSVQSFVLACIACFYSAYL
ncbi:glycoside hydrolase family 13 protein [Bisporella sp. PMI_857]|nr:glycoside hydrolase family 13 protein [Bisporella sp. PMI_857]